MNEIIRHIEFLLVTRDCVVIPGFGAVIAQCKAARYSDNNDAMLPPVRTFAFNAALTHDDGCLASSIARARSVAYESALSAIAEAVEAMRHVLSSAGELQLGVIGRLSMSEAGAITFTSSDRSSELTPAYVWLPEIELETVSSLAKKQNAGRTSRVISLGNLSRIAASIAILVALCLTFMTPIPIDRGQYASLGIESISLPDTENNYAQSGLVRRPGESTAPVKLYLTRYEDACEVADTASHAAYIRERKANGTLADGGLRFNADDRYYLIVASLATEEDALDFISKSAGCRLGILSKDNRFRIYAATGQTVKDAQDAASAIADLYPDTWVCRK